MEDSSLSAPSDPSEAALPIEGVLYLRPRSVIPGRQRWDVPVIKGQQDVAELLMAGLRGQVDIVNVQSNTNTGRLLLFHDPMADSTEIAGIVRRVAASVLSRERTTIRASASETRPREQGSGLVALGGVVVMGVGALVGSPFLALAGMFGSAVIIVRRAWRRSAALQSRTLGRSTLRPIRQIVGSRRPQFYVATSLAVVAQVVFLTLPLVVLGMFWVFAYGPLSWLAGLGFASALSQHLIFAGTIGVVLVAYAGLSYLSSNAWRNLGQDVQHDWRSQVYPHVQMAELRYLDDERATRLAEVMSRDVDQLGAFITGPATDVLQLLASFIVLIPVLLVAAPYLTWVAFLPVPIIVWLSFAYEGHMASAYGSRGESGALLNSQLVNNMQANITIKSLGAERYEIERIRRLSEAFRANSRDAETRTTAQLKTVQLLATAGLFGILLVGGLDVLSGVLAFVTLNTLIAVPNLMLGRVPGLSGAIEQYHRTVVSLERVQELLEIPIESDGVGLGLDVGNVDGEILFDRVTFAYPGRSPVLDNVSLRISAGKVTGIVGATGSGKTTIAKLLLHLHEVDSGRVLLDGTDIRELKLSDLRAAIGFVSQEPFLFDGSVEENIRYGSFDAALTRVENASRFAAADVFIAEMPQGYQTRVGERGVTLSGGQKQRISLARVILRGAPILILDEATSSVDNDTEAAIQEALRDFVRERTMVIIAHRLSTVRHCNWIYVLGRGGTIEEEGVHERLVQQDGMYASLWRRQIGEISK